MVPDDDDHDCGWKKYAKAQDARLSAVTEKLAAQDAELAAIKRQLLGKKSEKRKSSKLPPPLPPNTKPEETKRRRDESRAVRDAAIETEIVPLPVPERDRCCPDCGSNELRRVGEKPSVVIEHVSAHFRKRIYQRETLRCACGGMVSASPPERVGEKTHFASSFCAHVVVSKCRDSIPLYRLAKSYQSVGVPVARSTLGALLHRSAKELSPLYDACLALVPGAYKVNADETSFRDQSREAKTYLWAFVTNDLVVYRYATTRSGDIPKEVLGASTGLLTVDQHTGYNAVSTPGKRIRGGCLAHARRKVFEAREHPETAEALDLLRTIYEVERDAKSAGIAHSAAHLALRTERSRGPFAKLLLWARRNRRRFEPRSLMGKSTRYLVRHFRELGRFLVHAELDVDNNKAESALRRVALGRKNFLFVGHEQAGTNLAALYTLVATCEKHNINPVAYLTDVLVRVQTHPAKDVAGLLPHRWKPPPL